MLIKDLITELRKYPEDKEINIPGEEETFTSNIQLIEFDNDKLVICEIP